MIIDFEYRNRLLQVDSSLAYCYQCSTCVNACPIALLRSGKDYNPRKIIIEAMLGLKDKIIKENDPNPWLCSTCQKCVELCPQKVDLTEIFTHLKNEAFNEGNCPDAYVMQAQSVYQTSVAIPYSRPILKRREKLGLPNLKVAPVEEIQKLLEGTMLETVIKRRLES
ncbi:MAG: 4Fe-4S dicluster domain-containing protein [Promethearchaeota archaeon]